MTAADFSGLLLVVVIAFAAPLVLGLVPGLRFPVVVLEIVAGIAIGPSGFGWVRLNVPIQLLALVGLAFLLFLSGLEIDFERLRGRRLRLPALGFAISAGLALVVALGLSAIGLVKAPLLVAIILVATSLGVVVPVLRDANQDRSDLGQLVIAAASISDFGAIILLSLFFSREATGTATRLLLLAEILLVAVAVLVAIGGAERSRRISVTLVRLQDTTAQIRVRGAFLLLIALIALAQRLGLEMILGAFIAGAVLSLIDRDRLMTHPAFRSKLDAIGFGIFIPIFFIASGIQFDLRALTASPSGIARVPLFLLAILLVRGLPAILYRSVLGPRQTLVAALLQATSLPFIVAASMIGIELGLLSRVTASALIAAGLLSVLLFPLLALMFLRGVTEPGVSETEQKTTTNTNREALT